MNEMTFKEKMKRLEAIVLKLEDSQIDLEEAIVLFEEGLKLTKECNDSLSNFDSKIDELITKYGE